ncbi:MAG: 3'-5' exonuclease, partial [Bacteroidota bacterium]|nr:3'-5' exonuclease [Bacteroidota bacterium]
MIISKPIVVFDIETTGLDIINDRIVDISLIKVNS